MMGMVCLLAATVHASETDDLADLTFSYGRGPFEVANPVDTPVEFYDDAVWPGPMNDPFYLMSEDYTQYWTAGTQMDDLLRSVVITEANASEAWADDPLAVSITFLNDDELILAGGLHVWFETVGGTVYSYDWDPGAPYWSIAGNRLDIGLTLVDAYPADFSVGDEITEVKVEMNKLPEPATVLLIAAGAITMAARRRTY
jgi:hypothetical protein